MHSKFAHVRKLLYLCSGFQKHPSHDTDTFQKHPSKRIQARYKNNYYYKTYPNKKKPSHLNLVQYSGVAFLTSEAEDG
jgi:hypothetical protein